VAPFELAGEEVDFDLLAMYLKALANPGRLELLWQLRYPANPAELSIKPRRRDALPADRPMSRQTIASHLEQLEEIRVVSRLEDADAGVRWATNVPQVFALVEELRKLTAIPSTNIDVEETVASRAGEASAWREGPKVALLSGPWEGRVFDLAGDGPWTIGRSRSRSIAMTYDPFVSAEHASLLRSSGRYVLTIAPDARNPGRVNFTALAPGASRQLRHGDVLGLGRSLLLFHER